MNAFVWNFRCKNNLSRFLFDSETCDDRMTKWPFPFTNLSFNIEMNLR